MTLPLVICALLLAAFVWALQTGWFSRMERGFLLTMILAIASFTVSSALVTGFLAYEAAKKIVHQEVVDGLTQAGDIVEANLKEAIQHQADQLHEYAQLAAGEIAPARRDQLTTDLKRMDALNHEVREISVFDTSNKMLATSVEKADKPNLVAVGTALDGHDYVSGAKKSSVTNGYELTMATPIRDASNVVAGALSVRYDLQHELSVLIGSTGLGKHGDAVIASDTGRVLAHVDPKRIDWDVSSYRGFQEGKKGPGWIAGKTKLFVYRPVDSPSSGDSPPHWVLFMEMTEVDALAPIRTLRNQILFAIAIMAIPGLLVGWRVAMSISHPLGKLAQFVRKVQGGDFTGRVAEGRDELGRLGTALNQMTLGLAERDRVKELFGRYVAPQVSDKIMKGEVNLEGESRRLSILFSDIRSFTAMSEQMSPAQVVTFLNNYFSEMVEAVFEQGGILDKFMGDGLMAVFGSVDDAPDHPRRAVLAALRMKALLGKINGVRSMEGKPPIAIGVGVHTDEVIVGNIGSRKRLEYTVIGDGVNTCSRVQTMNKEFGTTILITQTTYEEVKDEFDCRLMPERELRGKTNALSLYEVLSVKTGSATTA